MNTPDPSETEIIGGIKNEHGVATNDEQLTRIWWLITNKLDKIATADNGWEQLYRDPNDGRFWELFFPRGELQAGGPPALHVVTCEVACEKYHVVTP
jgi:hypothetical protein